MPYVTDTHSLIWHMTGDPKLSRKAKEIFDTADDSHESIVIPCIVFFELIYLVEKGRIAADIGSSVAAIASSTNYGVEPLCLPIIQKSISIPRQKVADPWDRLIAATSLHLSLPLISRDERLKDIGIEVVW